MPTTQSIKNSYDELILVVKRTSIIDQDWHGLRQVPLERMATLITQHQEFHVRSVMETDQHYKQIIPYLIFKYQDSVFLMQRSAMASEQRLKNKRTLGIGGHVRQEDIQNKSIFHWAEREFKEEVHYTGNFTITGIGIINDDSNDVGKVHIGLAFLLEGDSDAIAVKSELKKGKLVKIEQLGQYYDTMEQWSQCITDYLLKKD